jgi:hypothetical protein
MVLKFTRRVRRANPFYWVNTVYCKLEKNKTRDVASSRSRRDHRKSKFGLRDDIKLIELYFMTKSEF